MEHRRGVIEIRMVILGSVKDFHLTRTSIAAVLALPYKRAIAITAELERNKLITVTDKHLFLTLKGQRLLARFTSLVKDLNVGTID